MVADVIRRKRGRKDQKESIARSAERQTAGHTITCSLDGGSPSFWKCRCEADRQEQAAYAAKQAEREAIRQLRVTGAPVRHCHRALTESAGDIAAALLLLKLNSYVAMGPVTESETWFIERGAWS